MTKNDKKPSIRFKGFTDSWEQRKLGDIASISRGLTYKPSSIAKEGIRILRSSNIFEDAFVTFEEDVFVENDAVNIDYINNGDILVTSANGSPRLVGKHAIVDDLPIDSAVPGGFMLKISTDYPVFINASMSTKWYKDFLSVHVSGGNGAIGNLKGSDLVSQNIMIPNATEIKKISSLFQSLDNLITLHQRKLDTLGEFKSSMLRKMFPDDSNLTPKIRFKGFTDSWEQCKLGEFLVEFSNKSKIENEFELLSSTNSGMEYRDGRVSGSSNKGYKIVDINDLVLSPQNLWLGNINVNTLEKGIVSPSYKTFHFKNVDSNFIKPILRTTNMMEMYRDSSITGASIVRKSLDLDLLLSNKMSIPSIEEQNKISNFFVELDTLITLHQRKLKTLKEFKKSMLNNMFI